MTAQKLCGLFLFAVAVLLAVSVMAPQQKANAKPRPDTQGLLDVQAPNEAQRSAPRDGEQQAARELSPQEKLGKKLFFDENLSMPRGQACASCHDPGTGFTSPSSEINAAGAVMPGAVEERTGNRKPPSVAYAGGSPVLHFQGTDGGAGRWVGGLFCDGRATGQTLGDPLVEQATEPFLNDLEQNLNDVKDVIRRVARSEYAGLFERVWGKGSLKPDDVEGTFEKIGRSIAAYERSHEVSAFTSKYDFVLQGEAELTEQEALGLQLFNGKAACFFCHSSAVSDDGEPPVFTDFTYHNIGTPKNPENPFYDQPRRINPDGEDFIDEGLGGFLRTAGFATAVYEAELGKHKVPTLRNVDARPSQDFVRAYGHNGVFKSLEEIVHFYNTRDVEDWDAAEVQVNVNPFIGDLGLTDDEEAAVVSFLKTLTDGYKPPRDKPDPNGQDDGTARDKTPKQQPQRPGR